MPQPTLEVLYMNSDNLMKVSNLRDFSLANKPLVSGATVTARVLDATTGAVIVSGLSLPAISGKVGCYQGTIPSTVVFTEGQLVFVEITADAGAGKKRIWKIEAKTESGPGT